jgi:hypothetical protein
MQGATIHDKVIVDIDDAFVAALSYVILSRTTHRDKLVILGSMAPEDFASIMPRMDALTPQQLARLPAALPLFLQSLEQLDEAE